jgi:acylphosphatase
LLYHRPRARGFLSLFYTQDRTQELNITGWVKNLPDKRVEVYACGEVESLQRLREHLKQGPTFAKITAIECEELPFDDEYADFIITH